MQRCILLVAALLALSGCVSAPIEKAPEPGISAVAKVASVEFRYESDRFAYTCVGLQSRLSAILKAAGAAAAGPLDIGCDRAERGALSSARVGVEALVMVPATAENLEALTQYTPTDRLLARVQSRDLPAANELTLVPAQWTRRQIDTARTRGLDPGDCDLMLAFAEQLAPQLGLRVIDAPTSCARSAAWKFSHRMTVESLLPITRPPAHRL